MSEPTILVVEDEPSISEVVTIYLQRAGYQVTVAQREQEFADDQGQDDRDNFMAGADRSSTQGHRSHG